VKVTGGALLLAMMLTGCAAFQQMSAFPAPAPPPQRSIPAPPSPPEAPAAPPPSPAPSPPGPPPRVLSPGVEDEQRMRREAQKRIEGTERLVRQIEQKKLVGQQQQNFETIQSFLAKAKEALSAWDLQRAFTLADKAYLLADELSRTLFSR